MRLGEIWRREVHFIDQMGAPRSYKCALLGVKCHRSGREHPQHCFNFCGLNPGLIDVITSATPNSGCVKIQTARIGIGVSSNSVFM